MQTRSNSELYVVELALSSRVLLKISQGQAEAKNVTHKHFYSITLTWNILRAAAEKQRHGSNFSRFCVSDAIESEAAAGSTASPLHVNAFLVLSRDKARAGFPPLCKQVVFTGT